jgi:hypothetical protein
MTVEVLVKNKETGEPRTMSYKSYVDTQYMWDLIGQCDHNGNLIPGDPNLEARHRKVTAAKDADRAGDVKTEVEHLQAEAIDTEVPEAEEPEINEKPQKATIIRRSSKPKTAKA